MLPPRSASVNAAPKFATCVNVTSPPAGIIVPAGITYFFRLVEMSLRNQLLTSIGAAVVFFNSTQSPVAVSVASALFDSTSLTTTAPALMPGSAAPGAPFTAALGRQPAAVL